MPLKVGHCLLEELDLCLEDNQYVQVLGQVILIQIIKKDFDKVFI